MKKWIFVLAIVAVYQSWGSVTNFFQPPIDYAAAHDGKVIMYGTSWCGYCAKTRKLLERNNIAYYEYDIEKSAEGNDQFDELGGKGVPLILIEGELVRGYNPSRILKLSKGI